MLRTSTSIRSHLRPASHRFLREEEEEEEEEETTESGSEAEAEGELAPQRPRSRFAEEDLYCRIKNCLGVFKTRRICMNHRARHFSLVWRCPGPCQTNTTKQGLFARDETLRKHLLSPRFARCKDAALQSLGLESIPETGHGSSWMRQFRKGHPDRPWERAGFQLTDLETVKKRLRDPYIAALPLAVPSISSRRS
jgi:hypothetical protein